MLLHSHFEETCRRLPHKLALVCGEQRLSYGELAERVEGLAAMLQQRGVRRGDRVAL